MTQVVLPAEVKSIASGAFWNSHIESLVLNEGLESIELQAFSGLASVVFPASLKEIGEHAFEDCVALTEIDLSKTALQEISSDAFRETTNVETITFEGEEAPELTGNPFPFKENILKIVVPSGKSEAYKAKWGSYEGYHSKIEEKS